MSDAVVFEDVTYRYPGSAAPAVEGISLRVKRGSCVAIVGPNGGGKTTLLRLLMGLARGFGGRIEVDGRSPEQARRRGAVGYVAQRNEAHLAFPVSARQVVRMGAQCAGAGRSRPVKERVERSLERVGAHEYADRPIGSLSGGQVQRVMVARALALEPAILALDEPLVGIDAAGQARFGELMRSLRADESLTILLVSHDLRAVASGASMCDRVACVRGTMHFHDAPSGITPQLLAEVFQHDLTPIFGDVHVDAHDASECRERHG